MTSQAAATTPPLAWQGVTSLQILCLVAPATFADKERLQKEICDTVRGIAAEGAPVSVKPLAFGDPALLEPGTATLLVHANVQDIGGQRLLVVHVRDFRPGPVDAQTFFTAAPRAVRMSGTGAGPELKTLFGAMLAEILPWRQGR